MKLPKPLFPEPSGRSSRKPRKKRKGGRVMGVCGVVSGEFSEKSSDCECVDLEGPEHPATEEEPSDALREFARLAAMPGATVYASVEGGAELCERLGIEFCADDEPGKEEADPN